MISIFRIFVTKRKYVVVTYYQITGTISFFEFHPSCSKNRINRPANQKTLLFYSVIILNKINFIKLIELTNLSFTISNLINFDHKIKKKKQFNVFRNS